MWNASFQHFSTVHIYKIIDGSHDTCFPKGRAYHKKLSWVRTPDLLWGFFLLIKMLCFCFLHLNLTITVPCFFRWWHAGRSSGFTSWSVGHDALQMPLSRLSTIDAGTGLIFKNSQRWYWALLTVFLSNWAILSLNKWLQSLLTVSSEERISISLIYEYRWYNIKIKLN